MFQPCLFLRKKTWKPFYACKKNQQILETKKKRPKCCAWCSTNSCLCPSIVTVKLLHQWSVAHCFSKLCLYRALSSIFSKSHHLATFNCNMVAIKLKFWSPPKVEREREKEWKSSDVWRQKLLTTKLLRPCVQQIMFNTILIYRSAEKHLYSKVSPNIGIKTLNHLIFSHHTLWCKVHVSLKCCT